MKSKTLISIAIAGTFGLSTAAFAGSGHEVITPFSPNESGPAIFQSDRGFGSTDRMASTGSTSDHAGGTVSGSVSSDGSQFLSGDHSASLSSDEGFSMDDSLAAADEGIYSEYYLVSWTPITVDSWDYYVIDTGSTPELVVGEGYFLMPSFDVVTMSIEPSSEMSDHALGE